MQDSIEDRFYALVQAPPIDKKRKCLKCGKTYRIKGGSRRGACHPCAVINDRLGKLATYHNICA